MTASRSQPRAGRGRRIIERPRLIKLLDDTDARTILLLAPAGYGKTTLARQWLKGATGIVSLSLTPSDRDVAWLAEEIARQLEAVDPAASRLIREHVKAQSNPQRAHAQLGRAVAEALETARIRCLALDNYETLSDSAESQEFIAAIEQSRATRLLVASRVCPSWASSRRTIYGDLLQIGREELKMTEDEVAQVLGQSRSAHALAEKARGWAAVIGLAATVDAHESLPDAVPQTLHRYLAEELLSRVSSEMRTALFTMALFGRDAGEQLRGAGRSEDEAFDAAEQLGFGVGGDEFELHPLLEEFLLDKLVEEPGAIERIREAIMTCVLQESWDQAIRLVTRFDVRDLIEITLEAAFKPLVRTGRLTGLTAIAALATQPDGFPPPVAELVLAEVALCDGELALACELAERAGLRVGEAHSLAPRAATIAGQAHFLRADFPSAQRAFAQAKRLAQDDRDETDALHGLASSSIFGEHPDAGEVVEVLRQRRRQSPVDFIRYATGDVAYRQLGGAGLGDDLDLHVIRQALPHADDPRARSAAAYTVAYSQTTVADYRTANEWLGIFFDEATRFNLDFAMPLANYVVGRIALGERRYGDAERALQAIEDHAARTKDERHRINATALRARLVLQNGDPEAALWCVTPTPTVTLIPSWYGEYIATRALALAVLGHRDEAVRQADHAAASTACYEVHSLSLVAKAVAEPSCSEARRRSVEFATRLNAWDPVLCGARSSTPFALGLSDDDATRGNVETLYARTGDVFLARRSGIRIRATSRPDQVLTRRELEVLGLIARGFKNSEISRALYISESTTKVHVRHILEKLGVRTRAEAVARYENFRREAD